MLSAQSNNIIKAMLSTIRNGFFVMEIYPDFILTWVSYFIFKSTLATVPFHDFVSDLGWDCSSLALGVIYSP